MWILQIWYTIFCLQEPFIILEKYMLLIFPATYANLLYVFLLTYVSNDFRTI